ncbi:MAG: hypothetical protein DMG01_20230 [Acidobacteria bacterium]|nr:MAG: hypothetical protein DMG01_20230 [Acidobacteriota bacterium]
MRSRVFAAATAFTLASTISCASASQRSRSRARRGSISSRAACSSASVFFCSAAHSASVPGVRVVM